MSKNVPPCGVGSPASRYQAFVPPVFTTIPRAPWSVIARKETCSMLFTSGSGPTWIVVPSWKPKLSVTRKAKFPPLGAASPIAATFVTVPFCQRRIWSSCTVDPRATKTTVRASFIEPGPISVSVPPRGEGSPMTATFSIVCVLAT
jgi:hypothetical protein